MTCVVLAFWSLKTGRSIVRSKLQQVYGDKEFSSVLEGNAVHFSRNRVDVSHRHLFGSADFATLRLQYLSK
jgi:hypothetical protein